MKITWIGPYKPVPDRSGADLRSFYLMRELARCGADLRGVFLGSHGNACNQFLNDVDVVEAGEVVSSLRALRRRLTGEPLTVGRFHSPDLIDRIRHDSLVYVDHLHLVTNVLRENSFDYWLDEHNFESSLWEQYAQYSSWLKRACLKVETSALYRYELEAIRGSTGTSIPSTQDLPDVPADVRDSLLEIPNGVPDRWIEIGRERLEDPIDSNDGVFGFIGKYDWFPNRIGVGEFLDTVWQPFHRDHPTTELKLAGAAPPDHWRTYDGVDTLGYVEAKADFFEAIDALVLPLNLGSGTRLKALEAAAKGIPLISTEKGIEGLKLPQQTCVTGVSDLRAPLEQFVGDPGRWHSNRERAHRSVVEHYRWETIGNRLWDRLQSAR